MERYLALEAYSLPLAGKVIRETRREYRDHMAGCSKSVKKMSDWITQWMHFMSEARRYNLCEIKDPEM